MSLTDHEAWKDRAACLNENPDDWFPEENAPRRIWDKARKTCARCPVQPQCLQYALTNDIRFGIWGGTTPAQRAPMHNPQGMMITILPQQHGSDLGYRRHWDRGEPPCEACDAAHDALLKGREERRRNTAPWSGRHGTRQGYKMGCRCDLCRHAQNAKRRAERAKRAAAS